MVIIKISELHDAVLIQQIGKKATKLEKTLGNIIEKEIQEILNDDIENDLKYDINIKRSDLI